MNNSTKAFVLIIAAIVVAAGLLAALALVVWAPGLWTPTKPAVVPPSIAPANASQPYPGAPSSPAPSANSSTNASALLDAQWALITNERVQQACLSQAKAAAAAQGYNSGMVFGCDCQASESSQTKSYQCQVSALDGQHPVSIICTKSAQSCQIGSQQGAATYTFDQLAVMANS